MTAPDATWRRCRPVITHRYDVLARFGRSLQATYREELNKLKSRGMSTGDHTVVDRLMLGDARVADADRVQVESYLEHSKVLATIYAMRQELAQLWQRSTASKEQLVRQLEDWCHKAEASGIASLSEFSRQLRRYA